MNAISWESLASWWWFVNVYRFTFTPAFTVLLHRTRLKNILATEGSKKKKCPEGMLDSYLTAAGYCQVSLARHS